jgi:hypothetical protein
VASLRELQHAFAAALKDADPRASTDASGCALRPVTNLAVYRNNAEWQFRNALSLSYPVLNRRVGDDYFRQLARLYRQKFPSRSGDLQWVGRHFATFLDEHLSGGDYAWLADLARLEWARELASLADPRPAVGAECLSRFAPEELDQLVFALQPSLQLLSSPYPVHSVWLANQQAIASPVDQSMGPEQFMVLSRDDHVEVARLLPPLFSYLCAIGEGQTLGEAMDSTGMDEGALLGALRFSFAQSLVVAVSIQSAKR